MSSPVLDRAAWASPWRHRSVLDKSLLCGGLLLVTISLPPWPTAVAVAMIGLVAAVWLARVRIGLFLRAVVAPVGFIAVGALSVAIGLGGTPAGALWHWGPLSLTEAGLQRAGTVAARGFAGMVALVLLAVTTPMVDLIDALRRLRIPEPLLEITALTYRLLFVLAQVAGSVHRAQTARLGHDGYARSLRSAGLLASVLLVHSWNRARRLEDGLAGRGHEGSLQTLSPQKLCSWRFRAITLAVLAGLVVLGVVSR